MHTYLIYIMNVFLKKEENFLEIDWKKEGAIDKITGDRVSVSQINGVKNKLKYFLFRYIL